MADIALAATQTLLTAVQICLRSRESSSRWMMDYEDQLKDLQCSVETVRKVLLDLDERQELSHAAQEYVDKLKDAVYDADDLFDEISTLAQHKQCNMGANFSEKVRHKLLGFFSPRNYLFAHSKSHEINQIAKKLNEIANSRNKFGFAIDSQSIRQRREETCSYVYAGDVIGREEDVRSICDMLLDSDVKENVCFFSIVGMGGLGKTTVAQLVFNDDRIKDEFPWRLWVCVSDQDGKQFDMNAILSKILEPVVRGSPHEGSSIDWKQRQLQENLGGKKYLIVLDDIWNENSFEWSKLKRVLMLGRWGSRIVVTTRSMETARVVGNQRNTYELKGLSEENSWRLFEMTAFDRENEHNKTPELIEIGKKIVEKCSNVPLAIKVVGSLLYGQGISKWLSLHENGLATINKGDNKILPILKLSYHSLESPLKSCFSYCALFPKDFVIEKEKLISLWMAQGYISQDIENAGEEYFSILLRRCFFQDIRKDEYGEIISCKIHDLMHDVAQEVSRNEICLVNHISGNMGNKIRHLFHAGQGCMESPFTESKIRTYLQDTVINSFALGRLVENWMCLRALDLHDLSIESLPDSIGKLCHLRYLDLSENCSLRTLPDSVTALQNLQTLNLHGCSSFSVWPKDFSKLMNLMHLNIDNCTELTHMPSGMDKLNSLCVLTRFVVVDENSGVNRKAGHLNDLKSLVKLKGNITIEIHRWSLNVRDNHREGEYLRGMKHLKEVTIKFLEDNQGVEYEALLEKLQPDRNLKGLILTGYKGAAISRSVDINLAAVLPNLVKIELTSCEHLKRLPLLSELRYLKSLRLHDLKELEYIEDPRSRSSSSHRASEAAASTFFPSLEYLDILRLKVLKGWKVSRPWFPSLAKLVIMGCPDHVSFPSAMQLDARNTLLVNLREVKTDRTSYLRSLPVEFLTSMHICSDQELQGLAEVEDVFQACSSSLRSLKLERCSNLQSLFGGLEHLTVLESLSLCENSKLFINDFHGSMPWKLLQHNLRSLELNKLGNMVVLPIGMQHLTSLQNLIINSCYKFEELPQWISNLSSLRSLHITFCNNLMTLPKEMQNLTSLRRLEIGIISNSLTRRLQEPDGDYWPLIRHIPNIDIY